MRPITIGRELTDSQRHALDTGRNLAVRAGAGSGKTTVLVERIIQLLGRSYDRGEPLELGRVVAVTYTRKAARELQGRLRTAFERLAERSPDRAEKAYWTACTAALPLAPIGTIDSLCGRILRDFSWRDPSPDRIERDFELLEGYDETVLKREAIDRVLTRLGTVSADTADARVQELAEACRWWLVKQGSRSLVSHLVTLLNHPVDPVTMLLAHQDLPSVEERVQAQWAALEAIRRLRSERTPLREALQALDERLRQQRRLTQSLQSLRDGLDQVLALLATDDPGADDGILCGLREMLLGSEGEPRKRGLTSVADLVVPLQATWGPLLRQYAFDPAGESAALDAADKLVCLLEPVHSEYLHLCHEVNAYDFLTVARRTRDLLVRLPEVRDALKQQYRYVLVDEFQDTNALQWEIVSYLVGAGPDGPLDADRLFIVGDPQQSIYRFRHADVSVFSRVQELIRAENARHGSAARPTDHERGSTHRPGPPADLEQRLGLMPLQENFRTLQPVPLLLLNGVFRHVFDPVVHGLDPERDRFEVSYQDLQPGQPPSTAGEIRYVIPVEPESADDGDAEGNEDPGVQAIRCLVDQLVSLHGQPLHKSRLAEPATLSWRHMAVLLPSRTAVLPRLEEVFTQREVPFVVTKGIGFWQRQEVRDVVCLASWLADPGDELALFSVLRGPVGQLSDTEVVLLAQLGGNSLRRGLQVLPWLEEADRDGIRPAAGERWQLQDEADRAALVAIWRELGAEAQERMRRTAARLEAWCERVDRLAHSGLLQRALDETGAHALYAAEAGGEQALANLERLFDTIRAEEARTAPTLARLARWLRDQVNESHREEQAALPVGQDAVQVMTVHAAKGLEFPVVAVLKLDRRAVSNRPRPLLVMSPGDTLRSDDAANLPLPRPGTVAVEIRHPLRPREMYRPRLLTALQRLDTAQQLAESRRLFYVAATRAEERLILVGKEPASGRGRKGPSWQTWFETALGLTEEDKRRGYWEDPAAGRRIPIITTPQELTRPTRRPAPASSGPLRLEAVMERPATPLLDAEDLAALGTDGQAHRDAGRLRWQNRLRPPQGAAGASVPGPLLGTLLQRLHAWQLSRQRLSARERERLLDALARNLLAARGTTAPPGSGEVRALVTTAEAVWQQLQGGGADNLEIRKLLDADGALDVPFLLVLDRWRIPGRFGKLLPGDGEREVVCWLWGDGAAEGRPPLAVLLPALALLREGAAGVRIHAARLDTLRMDRHVLTPADGARATEELRRLLRALEAEQQPLLPH